MAEPNDEFQELMRRLRAGSEDAAREIVARYGNAIRRAIRRRLNPLLRSKFDSADFTQRVWASFFPTPSNLHATSPQELMDYLLAVARHDVDNENRRRLEYKEYDVERERQ